jgi:hypothetical protein
MQINDHPAPANLSGAEVPAPRRCGLSELPPSDLHDPVVEAYKKDVDRSLLIKNLSLSPAERAEKFVDFMRFLTEMGRAGQRLRRENK